MDVLINLIVGIVSQYAHISNHHAVPFKYINFLKLYVNKAAKNKE